MNVSRPLHERYYTKFFCGKSICATKFFRDMSLYKVLLRMGTSLIEHQRMFKREKSPPLNRMSSATHIRVVTDS